MSPNASPSSDAAPWVIAHDTHEGFIGRMREIWQYRRILLFFSIKAIQALYAKTHLGVSWIFIRTLVPLAVGSFIFGTVMEVPSGGVPYFAFFLTGQVPWNCFDGPLIRASRGLDVNRQLLSKLYVPRIILPLGQMAAGIIEPLIITVVLACSFAFYRVSDGVWYVRPDPQFLVAAASVVLVLAFAFSLSLFTSMLQARARDMRFILRYVVGFWILFTPVIYPLSMVPEDIRWLAYLNPLTAPVETFKWAILPAMQHSWWWFGYSAAVTTATFLSGVWFFARVESVTMDRM
jgi:lipopolysaccharide transport system permease protein